MKLSRYFLIFFVFLSLRPFAQKEANIWYFGKHAGLDFTTNPPTVLTNGAINQFEGCSSICSPTGQLLFYTDGMTVWDKNHNAMPNGTGLFGAAHSVNSGFIVPKPGSTSIYYVFTTEYAYQSGKLSYSIVDMTLNGGLGDVTIKNTLIKDGMKENLAAVKHSNQNDIWLVAHERANNNFNEFLITNSGFSTTPTVISVGQAVSGPQGFSKFSFCADKIATTDYLNSIAEVFNFNNTTGAITSPQVINFPDYPHGIEFSQNGKYLYVAIGYTSFSLYQVNLATNTKTLVGSPVNQLENLQMAPNGKIYLGQLTINTLDPYDYVGVINNPEVPGTACNYVEHGVFLNTNGNTQCNAGLPNFVTNYYKSQFHLRSDTSICYGDSVKLIANSGYLSYLWSTGSTDTAIFAKTAGNYWCRVTTSCDTLYDTVTITIKPLPHVNLSPDTSICAGNSITFHAGGGFNSYHWQNGSTDSVFNASASGWYSVTVTNQCGSDVDSVRIINIYPKPQPDLGNDTVICTSSPITLDAGSGYTSYQWQNSSTGQTLIVNSPGTYSVTVTNSHNCQGADTIIISQGQQPDITLGENRDLCKVQSIVLDPGSGYLSYKWQDGSTGQTFTVTKAGTYSVTVTDDCGSERASVTISDCPECICEIPNAFTPNYDDENDYLMVRGKGFTDLEFKVYNRLGEQVFVSHNIDYGWDGKWLGVMQKSDVYVYVITAVCESGKKIFKKGNVTLLR